MLNKEFRGWRFLQKIFDGLASIELAVFVILAIAAIAATGTVYEAKYGADVASLVVYRSTPFTLVLLLFLLNVTFAALSRWPWRRHHIGFLVTHLGLIILLIGSFITRIFGVDGTIALAPQEAADSVRMNTNYLNVFLAVPGKNYEQLLSEPIEFNPIRGFRGEQSWQLRFAHELGAKPNQEVTLKVLDWLPYAAREVGVKVDPGDGPGIPAVHFRIMGSRANIDEWLFLNGIQGSNIDLGPALVRFQKDKPKLSQPASKRILFIYFLDAKDKIPRLALAEANSTKLKDLGPAAFHRAIRLGWMDFEFQLEEFYQKCTPITNYHATEKRRDSVDALRISLAGEEHWLENGAAVQVAKGEELFYVQYTKMQVPLHFTIALNSFKVDYYEGSRKAKSYESRVRIPGLGDNLLISMNEPLYYRTFTFYQSSYSSDEQGNPIVSVLSVNRDPGRWIKYAGCIMIVFGILLMFYFRPIYSGKSKYFLKRKSAA